MKIIYIYWYYGEYNQINENKRILQTIRKQRVEIEVLVWIQIDIHAPITVMKDILQVRDKIYEIKVIWVITMIISNIIFKERKDILAYLKQDYLKITVHYHCNLEYYSSNNRKWIHRWKQKSR